MADHPAQIDKSPYQYAWNNPVLLTDPDGRCPKCWVSAFRVGKKAYKIYKKTGKLTPKSLKKAGLDEVVDIAGDLQTVFSGDAGLFDRIGAAADLIVGTDFNNKGNKAASKALGLTDDAKNAKGGVYVLKDKDGTVKRTGRTKDLDRRKGEHGRGDETKDLEFQEVYRTDKYDEQRGLEGVLYEKHKGTANQANGGLNKNKAIRDNHPKAEQYLDAADNYLKKNGND